MPRFSITPNGDGLAVDLEWARRIGAVICDLLGVCKGRLMVMSVVG